MIHRSDPAVKWVEHRQARTVALNVAGRYFSLAVELALGLVMLPFNLRHLGASEYGLWVLAASIVAYFSMLDFGYGAAMERFVAHYRARRDAAAINEIASTLTLAFALIGMIAFLVALAIAANIGTLFNLSPAQARTGGLVLLMVGAQFAFAFPFGVFGAVCNGFQRTYLNGIVATLVAVTVAAVNIMVLRSGGTLVELVAATTAVRILGYFGYRLNAYWVFPVLRVRPSLFRRARLREMSGFSAYTLMQDVSNKVNYTTDPIVIAAALMTGAVAVWTIAQRLAETALQLTNQLNHTLFPIIVECDTARQDDRLRELLVQATRLSLATVLPVAGAMAILAKPVIIGWTGPNFEEAAVILQILALVVIVRVGSATAGTLLFGAGHHRLVSSTNAASAIVNIVLSVILIRTHGLPGVAVATLIPVTIRAAAVLVPVACARVGLPLTRFFRTAVLPALWPALVVMGGLALLHDPQMTGFWNAVLHGAGAALFYAVLFFGFAIGRHDRKLYLGKLRSITGWPTLETA